MFDTATIAAIADIATRLDVKPAALQAVAEVESAGKVFARVKGKDEPLIRWEGHYFDRRLTNGKRDRARKEKLASPKAGGAPNPASQAARWEIVARGCAIDRAAALESFSIGLGQVMTSHWKWLGYRKIDDLIALCRRDAAGQIEVMARFIEKAELADELRRLDFNAFARGYNGPAYRKNRYAEKMAAAYQRLSGEAPVSAATGMLRMGSKGERVRELQVLLNRAGYAVKADGDYGPATRDQVKAFQKAQRITADGVAGPETIRKLEVFKQAPDEKPGEQPINDVPEVKEATKGGGVLVLVVAVRDQVAETASYLTGIEAETAQTVANWLLAGSSIIGLGLAAYGLYGWWKSKQTFEGDVAAGVAVPMSADPVLP